jgi:hypothetical protein
MGECELEGSMGGVGQFQQDGGLGWKMRMQIIAHQPVLPLVGLDVHRHMHLSSVKC